MIRRYPNAALLLLTTATFQLGCAPATHTPEPLRIDTTEDWSTHAASHTNMTVADGTVTPTRYGATFTSTRIRHPRTTRLAAITFEQSPAWNNWTAIPNINPPEQHDAIVAIALGPQNYYTLGVYNDGTIPFAEQCYHAWHSTDMIHWEHRGPVSNPKSRWVTTAEYVDGAFLIYYDYPNDEDPHLIIDHDLDDGIMGQDVGLVFRDDAHGSDCSVIRDLDGTFHLIHEDWSPINARQHSWDSPLAGHATSPDGITPFTARKHVIDERTTPTGDTATYNHPFITPLTGNELPYDMHEPNQDAFGDYTTIRIGDRYYVFCDYHPADDTIRIGRWTTTDLNEPYEWCGELGIGHHPDPTICFAEGQFHLIVQRGPHDYVSPGPWIDALEARAGADTDDDGTIDTWTDWTRIREHYDHTPGFIRVVRRTPATLDTSSLPAAKSFQFEFRILDDLNDNTADMQHMPAVDSVLLEYN